MVKIYSGEEYTYDNLGNLGYDSERLLVPYDKFYYTLYIKDLETENSFTLDDKTFRSLDKIITSDVFRVNENYRKTRTRTGNEEFSVSDKTSRIFKKTVKEQIRLSDSVSRLLTSTVKEDPITFVATISDNKGNVAREGDEFGVLFDFELIDRPVEQEYFQEWVNKDSPVGYDELRPFVPGEYEYDDAYVGFRLAINPLYGRFGVTSNTAYVDVEDTVEKGNSESNVGGLKRVEFNKKFYTTPQIQCQIIYAQENCYAVVPMITKEYFEFGIKSLKTGNYIAGEINWIVDGY